MQFKETISFSLYFIDGRCYLFFLYLYVGGHQMKVSKKQTENHVGPAVHYFNSLGPEILLVYICVLGPYEMK